LGISSNGIGVGRVVARRRAPSFSYAMDITTFDPLENGLMFERFLSVEPPRCQNIDMTSTMSDGGGCPARQREPTALTE
jgi:hypothetical protein